MIPIRTEDVFTRCPFYKDERRRQIICEGLTPGGSLRLCFAGDRATKDHKLRRCRRDWESCLIARMLDGKYEEGG